MQLKQMLLNGYVLVFHLPAQFEQTTVSDDPSTVEDDAFVGQKAGFWMPTCGTRSHLMNFVGYNDHIWIDVNSNGAVDAGEKGARVRLPTRMERTMATAGSSGLPTTC